jgi:CRP/FNR family cyclic AMP-dependent transcriptional regulator
MEQAGGSGIRLRPDDVDALAGRGAARQCREGQVLFVEGEPSGGVVLLRSGLVKVVRTTTAGREVLLALRGPGDLLGEQSALDEGPRSATAVCASPTEAVVVPPAAFRAVLLERPALVLQIAAELSRRLRDADGKRSEHGSADVAARVAGRLTELADRFGEQQPDGVRIALPLSQEELAGWTGASREAVAAALRVLRSRGWVSTGRRSITVHDLGAVRARAG